MGYFERLRNIRQITAWVCNGFRWQNIKQIAKPDDGRGFTPTSRGTKEERKTLRRWSSSPTAKVPTVLQIVGPIESSDPVFVKARPFADGAGSDFVRNHAQRQVEALEIAAIAMTPYPHTHILRFEIEFASRN
jgi:hypothetical protein